jgi:putative hydrolase of the HAD superfamily
MRNINIFGFGIKSFALSMIETAVEITNEHLEANQIRKIMTFSKQMLNADIQLLDHVEETLADLSLKHDLMLITKGDTFEQEKKIARTGIAGYFKYIEIVGAKTSQIYASLLGKYGIDATRFIMVGNALKSDIIPVLEIGGKALYIHYEDTWAHENEVKIPQDTNHYYEIERIDQVPALIDRILERGSN